MEGTKYIGMTAVSQAVSLEKLITFLLDKISYAVAIALVLYSLL